MYGTGEAVPYVRTPILGADGFSQARCPRRTVHRDRYRTRNGMAARSFAAHFFNGVRRFLAAHLVKLLAPGLVSP